MKDLVPDGTRKAARAHLGSIYLQKQQFSMNKTDLDECGWGVWTMSSVWFVWEDFLAHTCGAATQMACDTSLWSEVSALAQGLIDNCARR